MKINTSQERLTVLEAWRVLFQVSRLGLMVLEELGTLAVILLLCKLTRRVPLLPQKEDIKDINSKTIFVCWSHITNTDVIKSDPSVLFLMYHVATQTPF